MLVTFDISDHIYKKILAVSKEAKVCKQNVMSFFITTGLVNFEKDKGAYSNALRDLQNSANSRQKKAR